VSQSCNSIWILLSNFATKTKQEKEKEKENKGEEQRDK